jgi:hypothetical protein
MAAIIQPRLLRGLGAGGGVMTGGGVNGCKLPQSGQGGKPWYCLCQCQTSFPNPQLKTPASALFAGSAARLGSKAAKSRSDAMTIAQPFMAGVKRPSNEKVPRGTAERFFRPGRDLMVAVCKHPSHEWLGYFQRSASCPNSQRVE